MNLHINRVLLDLSGINVVSGPDFFPLIQREIFTYDFNMIAKFPNALYYKRQLHLFQNGGRGGVRGVGFKTGCHCFDSA